MTFLERMNQAELEAAGIAGWSYGRADQVRFYELDALNHVNNNAFLRWFETVRVGYFRDYGFSDYKGPPDDPMLVVRHQSVDYLAPMFQDERYVVTARARLLKPSSFVMDFAVHSGNSVKATGSAVIVSLEHDGKTRRAHKAGAVAAALERDRAAREGF